MANISKIKLPSGVTYDVVDNTSGYITGYTETDPVFSASPAAGITAADISNWNAKSDTDEKLKTSSISVDTVYHPVLGNFTSTSETKYHSGNFRYSRKNNIDTLQLGQVSSGATGKGQIVLCSGSYYTYLQPPEYDTLSDNETYTLPTSTGTIALTSDIPTKTSDLTNDSGFITSYTDTKNTAGATNSDSKLYLIGATERSANPQTYSNLNLYFNNGLHSVTKLSTNYSYSDIEQGPDSIYIGVTDDDSYDYALRVNTDSLTFTGVGGRNEIELGSLGTRILHLVTPTNNTDAANKKYVDDSIAAIPTASITLNGTSTTSASFYAPTSVGTSGQFLKSSGSGAPTWVNLPTVSSTTAGIVPMSGTDNSPRVLCATTNGYVYWESFEVWDSTVQDQVGNYTQDEEGVYLAIQEATTTEPGLMSAADKTAIATIPTNWLNGSATGSVRTSGSTTEDSNYTMGNYAVAEGHDTEASGNCSHAAGLHTIAQRTSQTVIGQYNILDTSEYPMGKGDYLFIIGNGTSENVRSNALAVKWDGTVETAKGNLSGVQIVRW